jgi:hypothetical protein
MVRPFGRTPRGFSGAWREKGGVEMRTGTELIAEMERLGEEYARLLGSLSAEALHRRPREDWLTAAELGGHAAELPVAFAEQARELSESPGLEIGREPDDPRRLLGAAKLAKADPDEVAAAVRDGIRQAAGILRSIPTEGWQVRGHHHGLGELTVAEVAEQFILGHLRDHLAEAQAAATVPTE